MTIEYETVYPSPPKQTPVKAYQSAHAHPPGPYHEAEEEADLGHVGDRQLAHRAEHVLVILGGGVGHTGQLGLQGLGGGQLTDLHDITETHPLLPSSRWKEGLRPSVPVVHQGRDLVFTHS